MADGLLLVSQFVAAGLLLLLAVGLLAIKFNSRVNRAFALYLLFEGLAILCVNVARMQGETEPGDLWLRLAYYPLIVLPISLGYFLVVYRRPKGPGLLAASIAALVAAGTLLVLHALDSCSFECLDGEGGLHAGPLLAFAGLKPLLQASVAMTLAVDVARGAAGVRSKAVALVALAFGLLATFDSGLGVSNILAGPSAESYEPEGWIAINRFLQVPALVIALGALGLLFRTSPWDLEKRTTRSLLAAAVVAVGLSILRIVSTEGTDGYQFGTFLAGSWRTLMPMVVVYALLRHRLFDIDLRVRSSVAFALVAIVFGSTYFLVSEGLEAVVSSRYGTLGGLAAAGLLTLLAKPITGLARRIAKVVVPGIHGLSDPDGAAAIYRAQFLIFNEDGFLTAKERRLLDHLRRHLKVRASEAARIEQEVAAQASNSSGRSMAY